MRGRAKSGILNKNLRIAAAAVRDGGNAVERGIHEKQINIGPGDSDLFGRCRPAALMDCLQILAMEHAELLGISRDAMIAAHHCAWLLAREWYRLDRPVYRGETVTIRTWPNRMIGASFYRDFDILVNGEPVGEAVSVWVLADLENRALLRVEQVPELAAAPRPDCLKAMKPKRLSPPADLAPAMERTIRYSDADINGHMNNARYADVICDALHVERLPAQFAAEMQINFLKECRIGERLTVLTAQGETDAFVRGVDGEGCPHFDAKLQFLPVPAKDENDS